MSLDKVVNWKVRSSLTRQLFAEFLGTFLLVVITLSVGATTRINPGQGLLYPTLFSGLALFVGTTVALPVSGGQLNPALTITLATIGAFPWWKVAPYIVAQLAGAFVATSVYYLEYFEAIHAQVNASSYQATIGFFASAPVSDDVSYVLRSFNGTFWGGFVFFLALLSVVDANKEGSWSKPNWFKSLALGFLLMTVVAAFGVNGGPVLNPAADIAPRLFASCAGWAKVIWADQGGWYALVTSFLAPTLGGVFGGWTYRYLISNHYDHDGNDQC